MRIRVYRNQDVKRIIAFIPPGHMHTRLYIEFDDQGIILNEATISAILRAYINIAHHPTRRAIELINYRLDKKKFGYAKYQLLESEREEDDILNEAMELYVEGTSDE
ncbi:MAG: hypothetical protein DRJ64_04440 [Thermoprotei archaeon]|nr:MAG: hypothetical protein DRJ64_04440 [Thermoprotei archaeon]